MTTRQIFACVALMLLTLGCAFAQTAPTQLQAATLPTYLFMGPSYNQYTGWAGVISGIEPESQGIGLLASESADLVPTPFTDPATKKTGYLISSSFRFGQHKILLNTAKPQLATDTAFHPSFQLALGGDAGASFTSTQATAGVASSVAVGFSGSFTLSAFYRFQQHWAAGLVVRALYMSAVGPNGSGAWNPVIEPGLVYCK